MTTLDDTIRYIFTERARAQIAQPLAFEAAVQRKPITKWQRRWRGLLNFLFPGNLRQPPTLYEEIWRKYRQPSHVRVVSYGGEHRG